MHKLALTALFPLAVLGFVALFVSGLGELLLQQSKVLSPAVALGFAGIVLAVASYYSIREPRPRRRKRPSPFLRLLDRSMQQLGMMSPFASRIYDAIVSGFVATMAMALVLVGAYGIGGKLASNGADASFMAQWLWHLTHNTMTNTVNDTLFIAIFIDVVVGLFWACLYVLYADRLLQGAEWPEVVRRSGWARGMTFALLPWALSVLLFLPVAGGGFLGQGLGAGPLPIVGNLILHLVYGGVLGGFHALSDLTEPEGRVHLLEHQPVLEHGERGAALGIVVGVFVGLVLGGLYNGGRGVDVDGTILVGQVEVMLALAAFLGAGGALVGSMIALNLPADVDEDPAAPAPPGVTGTGDTSVATH